MGSPIRNKREQAKGLAIRRVRVVGRADRYHAA